jgi:hypothetical protein
MAAPVKIDLLVGEVARVRQAFESVEQAMTRMERNTTREGQRGSQARTQQATKEARAREKEFQQLAKQTEKWKRDEARAVEKGAQQAARAAARGAQLELREKERGEREKLRLVERSLREETRAKEQAAAQAERIAQREAAAVARAQQQQYSRRRTLGRNVGGAVTGAVGRTLGTVASIGGAAMGIAGGYSVADVVQGRFAAERAAAQLINATTTSGAAPQGATVQNILGQAGAVSQQTAMSKEEVVSGALAYSRKARGGDFAGAMSNMGFFAKMAKVTGANIEDIAGAAGTLQSQNQNLKAPEMQQMLLDVYAQGKAGSMSMVDVAKQIGTLSSTRSAYAGDAATNQRKLLALGQLAAPEGTVEEAGTFIKDLTIEAGKHRKSTAKTKGLEEMGVKYDKYGRIASPENLVTSVFKGTGGDITKIEALFGARGTALFRALQPAYTAAGGGEKGLAAVQKTMASVTSATMTGEDLEKQLAVVMNTSAEKFATASEKVKEAIEEKLVPYLDRFAEKLNDPQFMANVTRFIDGLGRLAEFVVNNPFKAVGALIAVNITKDLAGAAIGEAVKSALVRLLAGSAVPVPGVGGAAAGGAGGAAKGAAGVGAATLGLAAAAVAGTAMAGGQLVSDVTGKQMSGMQKAGQLNLDVSTGRISGEAARQQVKAAKEASTVGAGYKAALAFAFGGGMTDELAKSVGVGPIFGGTKKLEKFTEARQIANDEALSKAIEQAVVKGVTAGYARAPSAPGGEAARSAPLASPARGGTT